MELIEREGFIFYRSFYEATRELNESEQLAIYNAIAEYSFTLKEPNLEGIAKTIWILIKPQIEANNKRYLNGKKAKEKQNRSKTVTKEKEKEKEKEKDKEKEIKEEAERFIVFWNKLFNKNHIATDDFINAYLSKRKKYEKHDVEKGIKEYHMKNKNNLGDKEWFDKYYLTPYKFIKQSNGFISYI